MKVLITGASGFVGQHVCRELKDQHELLTPSRQELDLLTIAEYTDLAPSGAWRWSNAQSIANYMVDNKVQAVVHLAATCGGIGINKDNPGRFIYENLQMGINVLEAARWAGVKKVVNLGTVCSYPKYTDIPFQEKNIWNGYPEETNAPYGIAKKTIMEMGIAYARQYRMDVTNLVPVNMAGEYDNFDKYSSHVIPALIKKFENPQYAMGESLGCPTGFDHPVVELWGTGSASREFLYAGDCARAIEIALQRSTGPEPINLGTGQEITIRDLANLVKKVGGYDAEIVWDDTKPDGQPRRSLDITRAKNILRWEPVISLEETLRRTIRWYRANRIRT
jgi:GDP-L-fucose synthase